MTSVRKIQAGEFAETFFGGFVVGVCRLFFGCEYSQMLLAFWSANGGVPVRSMMILVYAFVARFADFSVVVYRPVSEILRARAWTQIAASIIQAIAVDVIDFVGRIVDGIAERIDARSVAVRIELVVAIEIVEASEMMLPTIGRGDGELTSPRQAAFWHLSGRECRSPR